jgi:hypothetical protein
MIGDIPLQCKEFLSKALKVNVEERLTQLEVTMWIDIFKDNIFKDQSY